MIILRSTIYLTACFLFFTISLSAATEYQQVAGLIDLRTTFSDGSHDLDVIVQLARDRGARALFLNDHDRVAMEYGVWPLRNIVKKKIEMPSVNQIGAQDYLDMVQSINLKNPDMVIFPGVESSPHYYWTGTPFMNNLTAHNWERHILTIGLDKAVDYENLPSMHNTQLTATNKKLQPAIIFFLMAAILGLVAMRWSGLFRLSGLMLFLIGGLLSLDLTFSTDTPSDQYNSAPDNAPYQRFIDYVDQKGGMSFWNHLETHSGVGKKPPISVETKPYPEMLVQTNGYTGFAAIYGDRITVTEPGREWDQVLNEYCSGTRSRPVWGIATADFHKEGGSGVSLGEFPTIFLIKEMNKQQILTALRKGRMYAARGPFDKRFVLETFKITDPESGREAYSGEEINIRNNVHVTLRIGTLDNSPRDVTIKMIKGGKLFDEKSGVTPLLVDFIDTEIVSGKKSYYRVDVKGEVGRILSNPIFVNKQEVTEML